MLFNSYDFAFIFLPIGLVGFWLLSSFRERWPLIIWLTFISLAFYFFWSPSYLLLLLSSVAINWLIGELLSWQKRKSQTDSCSSTQCRLILTIGIIFNLALLGYFKYSNFLLSTLKGLGFSFNSIEGLILPLAISFYTFQQISYIADIFSGKSRSYSFNDYLLFVIFFPQLIAGPIVNPREMISQFRRLHFGISAHNLSVGLTVFAVGLFKKTVIADSVSVYATPIFLSADQGAQISFFIAWQASIAYAVQLYFDFSGYSDMAIGLSKIFNIKLPINFFSPYKANSISDFWRRWHISLGRFLRDYLYIPLGGNRRGDSRHYVNLLITMLLGGLWHGANWTFVVWGGLHGLYLCVNHGWSQILQRLGFVMNDWYHHWLARMLTLFSVIVSWVLFRAETLSGGWHIIVGMFGGSGFVLPESLYNQVGFLTNFGIQFGTLDSYCHIKGIVIILSALALTLFSPNLYQFMSHEPIALDVYAHLSDCKPAWYAWRPTLVYAFLTALTLLVALVFCSQPSEFLYFQF
ncbi:MULTISPECIES: MBOAT family protein [Cyanophyceae]|uniref:MBOAT family O-acyltransferase n=1 Tax=Cyanophyceae TaxID=3028117 RepID=UPI0016894BB4|nr:MULTISPECIES: MBOAT family protein [Cyanophyceae]MBD1917564.1 MBOAT family protein [Phormidium sp. FACHB-77]MBD2029561.1 MBOAT family protein [Phormidium sp. FACHB-322]MBD2050822.1 MBOAT family protein [Leptolyngbya sp. FACHB-60]